MKLMVLILLSSAAIPLASTEDKEQEPEEEQETKTLEKRGLFDLGFGGFGYGLAFDNFNAQGLSSIGDNSAKPNDGGYQVTEEVDEGPVPQTNTQLRGGKGAVGGNTSTGQGGSGGQDANNNEVVFIGGNGWKGIKSTSESSTGGDAEVTGGGTVGPWRGIDNVEDTGVGGVESGIEDEGYFNSDHGYRPNVLTVTKQVPVPVPHPYPVEILNPVPVKVPHPFPYTVDKPYTVEVEKPFPVTVEKLVPYTVEKKVPFPVYVPHKVSVPQPVKIYVPKHVPYKVRVPVKVPVPHPVYIYKKFPVYVNSEGGKRHRGGRNYGRRGIVIGHGTIYRGHS